MTPIRFTRILDCVDQPRASVYVNPDAVRYLSASDWPADSTVLVLDSGAMHVAESTEVVLQRLDEHHRVQRAERRCDGVHA